MDPLLRPPLVYYSGIHFRSFEPQKWAALILIRIIIDQMLLGFEEIEAGIEYDRPFSADFTVIIRTDLCRKKGLFC